ncbi:hybrid sensor histidine kinase/response regulator [Myxococcota bacterium]|nr:hybrid sensor histidine kinase/response regulator [Myxococcota bacterium]
MPTHAPPLALLVEDEPDHGLLLRILLERDGLQVEEAATVESAARTVARRAPDLVVLDVPAGLARGTETLRALRRTPGLVGVPVLALSAAHDRAARDALFEAGVDGLLGKPVVPWLLEWQVRTALRRHTRGDGPAAEALLAENRAWMSYLVHDMNNPLTVLGANLHLLGHDPLSPRQRRALDGARQAHERLSRLVRSLLDVERVDAGGRLRVDTAVLSIPALLDEVRFVLTPLAAPREIEIDIRDSGETLWPVDRELIERALINLGENAIRHSPKGGTLVLGAREEGERLLLTVADDGPGVPETERNRVFERHAQSGDRRSQGAAGLGLAFCRLVAEGHGGRAWVGAGPRGGAVFVVELPWRA